jgi:hypothetical protein
VGVFVLEWAGAREIPGMMETACTEAAFERLSWHDNHVYGLYLSLGDVARGDWRSDLILDIDHIVEWVCGVDGRARFRVAPATLTFHHVTDLRLDVAWASTGFQVGLHPISIGTIERALVEDQKICFDRPYYAWRIEANWPQGGAISFGASGFTQVLRAEPVLMNEQWLSPLDRPPFVARDDTR